MPSGDQAGERSCAPGVLVRLRASPFSAGTVTISPRNSNAARAPDGDSDAFRIQLAPLTKRARVSRRSDGTDSVIFCVGLAARIEHVQIAGLLVDDLPAARRQR